MTTRVIFYSFSLINFHLLQIMQFIQPNRPIKRFQRTSGENNLQNRSIYSSKKSTVYSQPKANHLSQSQRSINNLEKHPLRISKNQLPNNNSKLRKKTGLDKRKHFYFNEEKVVLPRQQNGYGSMSLEDRQDLEEQNLQLRTKLLDCEIKQRNYMQRINYLESACLKLTNSVQKSKRKHKTEEEDKFLRVLKKTYGECFGVTSLKQIWRNEKQLLDHWMKSGKQ